MGDLTDNLRQTARRLWTDRWPVTVLTVALAVGIGLVVTWLTVFNGILLKPWSIPDVDQVVTSQRGVSPTLFRQLRTRVTQLQLVAASQTCDARAEDLLDRPICELVSGDYFDVLRIPLAHGRAFRLDEDIAGTPVPVVIISEGLWSERYGRSPEAIGARLRFNGTPFTIIGVAAAGTRIGASPLAPRLWFPLATYPLLNPARDFLFDPEQCCVNLSGRRLGSMAAVNAELVGLYREFRSASDPREGIPMVGTRGISQRWDSRGTAVIALVFAGVLLVFLVAAFNAAILQFGRGVARRQEFLIRRALGASRGQMVRLLVWENATLAAVISALVLGVVTMAVGEVERRMIASSGDFTFNLRPDWTVTAVCLLLALGAVMASGIIPVLRGGGALTTARPRRRTRGVLLGAQVASGTVLIGCASLLVNAVTRISNEPGFDADSVARVTFVDDGGAAVTGDRATRLSAHVRGLTDNQGERLVASHAPLPLLRAPVIEEGRVVPVVFGNQVSPNYFHVLGVPIVEGRTLTASDGPDAVVINETFARTAWPGGSAVGHRFDAGGLRTVIGVATDLRGLVNDGAVRPSFFERGDGFQLVARLDKRTSAQLAAQVRAVDSSATVRLSSMALSVSRSLESARVVSMFAWAIGLTALVIAATGIFATLRLSTDQRRREIGIRSALGATMRHIVKTVVGDSAIPVALGVVTGISGAMLAAPVLRIFVADVRRLDATAFVMVLGVTGFALLLASWSPVRRALRVNPAEVMRSE